MRLSIGFGRVELGGHEGCIHIGPYDSGLVMLAFEGPTASVYGEKTFGPFDSSGADRPSKYWGHRSSRSATCHQIQK